MRAIVPALAAFSAAWPMGMAGADIQSIVAELPGQEEFEAPQALQDMQEGAVWLDLTIAPNFDPSFEMPDGTYAETGCSAFGPVEAKSVTIRTGSNHILFTVRPGAPETYAANLVACDYNPEYMTDTDPGHVTRVTGCYFAHATSIPTAVQWVLNPLPASACGIGD